MEPLQQCLGDAPRALDLVGASSNLRPEFAGAGERVRTGLNVHASPQAGRPIAAERPGAVNRLVGGFKWLMDRLSRSSILRGGDKPDMTRTARCGQE